MLTKEGLKKAGVYINEGPCAPFRGGKLTEEQIKENEKLTQQDLLDKIYKKWK